MGLEIIILILLAVVGMGLLIVEIFFIPGITIAGITGGLLIFGELAYGYVLFGPQTGHLILLFNGVAFVALFYGFTRSRTLNKLSLHTDIEAKIPTINQELTGKEGKTVSRLNPMGKIEVAGEYLEAKSPEGFIDEDTPIIVTHVCSTYVEVIPLNTNQ